MGIKTVCTKYWTRGRRDPVREECLRAGYTQLISCFAPALNAHTLKRFSHFVGGVHSQVIQRHIPPVYPTDREESYRRGHLIGSGSTLVVSCRAWPFPPTL